MLLLLVRHGSTVDADQKPTFAGAKNDQGLTINGRDQADAWADAMDKSGLLPAKVVCGTMPRTIKHLEPMTRKLGMRAGENDKRLNEPDFGTWEGKTNEEVDAMGGAAARTAWEKEGKWPSDAGFTPGEMDTVKNVAAFIGELQTNFDDDKVVVACAGNTIIRTILKLVPGAFDSAVKNNALKVATGSVSAIDFPTDGKPKVLFWNKKPEDAPLEDI